MYTYIHIDTYMHVHTPARSRQRAAAGARGRGGKFVRPHGGPLGVHGGLLCCPASPVLSLLPAGVLT